MLPTALNHMATSGLCYDVFLDLARSLGCVGVEFRNDLPGPLFDDDRTEAVRDAAKARELRILALAEVKRFNDWSDANRDEAEALMQIAVGCGAEAVSLIPRNDGLGRGNGERQANLRVALRELHPMLEAHDLVGLVEPLGFKICSLRFKAEAIEALGVANRFKLVHDTFHHTLAGGGSIFAEHTGIVHISGVTDPSPAVSKMRDEHRVLVGRNDRLGNIEQIEALIHAGYTGTVSFESFSSAVHAFIDPQARLAASFDFVPSRLAEMAA